MKSGKRYLVFGGLLILLFAVWTVLVINFDVKSVGVNGTEVGFSTVNLCFFKFTGVHLSLYTITDWLGLVPVAVCLFFAGLGLVQLLKRQSLFKADRDILILGAYYAVVILGYLLFEKITINYRPILIGGYMESSYPSSTTLLVLSVMPTLVEQIGRRIKNTLAKRIVSILAVLFMVFMVLGRLLAGVHWLSDIIGGVLLSFGLFFIYKGTVSLTAVCAE